MKNSNKHNNIIIYEGGEGQPKIEVRMKVKPFG